MVLLVYVVILLLSECFGSKLTFINKESSAIKLRPSTWKRGGNIFQFHIQTNRDDGDIFTIVNQSKEKLRFNMRNGIIDINQPLKSKATELYKPLLKQWNLVSLQTNKKMKSLELRINNQIAGHFQGKQWMMDNWLEAWFGAFQQQSKTKSNGSFIGCLKFENANHVSHFNHLLERRSLVLDGCVSACAYQSCENGGKCINNFRNILCDCLGTGYEGAICENVAPSLQIKNEDYIRLKSVPSVMVESPRIKSLKLRIKTSQENNGGLLFQSNLLEESIRIELHDGLLDIKINTTRGTFSTTIGKNLHDNQWHFFRLSIKPNSIAVSLDQEFQNEIKKDNIVEDRLEVANSTHPIILIGGNNEKGTNNFDGCLQQIQLNGINVIDSLLQKKHYFVYNGIIKECKT